jgi:hypothetical protein
MHNIDTPLDAFKITSVEVPVVGSRRAGLTQLTGLSWPPPNNAQACWSSHTLASQSRQAEHQELQDVGVGWLPRNGLGP